MGKVAIARCSEYDLKKVESTIRQLLKDIKFKMPKGKHVLVKPNVLGGFAPEKAVTTHPVFLEAVCRILKENNCKITIGDSSGFAGSTKRSMCESGLEEVGKKYGDVVAFEALKIVEKKVDGKILKKIAVPKLLFDADMVISLPKLKTHSLMTYTLGVKNLFGCIPGGLKPDYHAMARNSETFAELLCDIYQLLKPQITLTLVDGIMGMDGNGPAAGHLKKADVIMASDDPGALDYVAARMINLETPVMRCILERKLLDYQNVEVIGEIPDIPFEKPSSLMTTDWLPKFMQDFIGRQMVAHPHVREKDCIKCGVCMKSCPVDAIELKPYPEFDRKKCIDCYCCHELCPKHAIYLKGSFLRKLIGIAMHLKGKSRKK